LRTQQPAALDPHPPPRRAQPARPLPARPGGLPMTRSPTHSASRAARAGAARDTGAAGRAAGPEADHTATLSDHDIYLFNEGTHFRLHEKLGAHLTRRDGEAGVAFAVWAPSARRVSVVSGFNGWDQAATPMSPRASSSIWETFVPGLDAGAVYKYRIEPAHS